MRPHGLSQLTQPATAPTTPPMPHCGPGRRLASRAFCSGLGFRALLLIFYPFPFHAPPPQHLSLPQLEAGGEFLHSSPLRLWLSGRPPESQDGNTHALIRWILLTLTGPESPAVSPARVSCGLHVRHGCFPSLGALYNVTHCSSTAGPYSLPSRPRVPFPSLVPGRPLPHPLSFLLAPSTWAGIVLVPSRPQWQCTKNTGRLVPNPAITHSSIL